VAAADGEAWLLPGMLADDGIVMQLSDQTLGEFAVLVVTGILLSVAAAIMVMDCRGFLTSYAHSCWRFYQRRWYRRLFLQTSSSRAYYAGEARLRRAFRLVAVPALAMGVLVLVIEFAALFTGHVI
jgi:hypothetical protein